MNVLAFKGLIYLFLAKTNLVLRRLMDVVDMAEVVVDCKTFLFKQNQVFCRQTNIFAVKQTFLPANKHCLTSILVGE